MLKLFVACIGLVVILGAALAFAMAVSWPNDKERAGATMAAIGLFLSGIIILIVAALGIDPGVVRLP
jgi:threonine/homoserine/homoserine lactone efflux protein